MAAFAEVKTTILGALVALLLIAGTAGPSVARAGFDPAPADGAHVRFQEGTPVEPVQDDSGEDDDLYIGLAAGSFALLVLIGIAIGVYGLRED